MQTSFLLLGGNQGDRLFYLQEARRQIADLPGAVRAVSGIYQTAAWGLENQPDFLNQALQFDTSLDPEALLQAVNGIERALGRIRKIKWAARVIDIDILYYGQEVVDLPHLRIPHPFLQERRFALKPLAEIAPDWVHPVLNRDNAAMLEGCPDPLEVKLLA